MSVTDAPTSSMVERAVPEQTVPKRALLFDVFGTVVDWRSSVISGLTAFFAPRGIAHDWGQFALDWRALYQPSMEEIRAGRRDFALLDILHAENLDALMDRYDLGNLNVQDRDWLTRIWHRLDPWSDSVAGMTRLRAEFQLASLSNGNIALMIGLMRHGGLPFDAILGAEIAQAYKPDERVYLRAAEALRLAPSDCIMVAAHNEDLAAAHALGFGTAFIRRLTEYGPGQTVDLAPEGPWDFDATSLTDLADQMGLA